LLTSQLLQLLEGGKARKRHVPVYANSAVFRRNEELALVKSTLAWIYPGSCLPPVRHQSESHAFTCICHFVWRFFRTTCTRQILQSRESLAPLFPFSSGLLSASLCFAQAPAIVIVCRVHLGNIFM